MNPALDRQAKLLLFVFTLFSFASMLSGTFVPVYLWKQSESYLLVAVYIASQYISGGLIFFLAGYMAKRGKKRGLLQLGCTVISLFYIMILLLGESSSHYIVLLGGLYGAGLGLYWLAYNIYYFEISEASNRDKLNGWQGLLVAACGITAPWLASRLIVSLGQLFGYMVIFLMSLSLYIIVVLLSFRLNKRPATGSYSWEFPLTALKPRISGGYRNVGLAVMAQGVKEGMFLALLPFIIFMYTANEAEIGTYTLISSLVALAANYYIGKKVSVKYRIQLMYVGAIGTWLAILFIVMIPHLRGLLMYGAVNALLWPLFIIPFTSIIFDQIGASPSSVELKEELIVFRELALTAGRIIGLIPFILYSLWLHQHAFNLGLLLYIVGFSPVAAAYFINKTKKEQQAIG